MTESEQEDHKKVKFTRKAESGWSTGITWLGIGVVALIIVTYIVYVAIVNFTTDDAYVGV